MGTQSRNHPGWLARFAGLGSAWRGVRWSLAALLLVGWASGYGLGQTTQALAVPLLYPTAIAFDAGGGLYVAETNRHVVDRVDASGALTVVAGTGAQGFAGDGGPATGALFDSPQGLAVDGMGNLYVADTHNQRVRMVAHATGVVTTVAGNGAAGFAGDGAAATTARLSLPTALALDGVGNLYVADSKNHRIRRVVLATGVIDTVAGNGIEGDGGDGGAATAASLDSPGGLTVDGAGNLYVADTHNRRVRRVAARTGMITTVAGPGGLRMPRGLSTDSTGALYVADTAGQTVLRVAADGTVTAVAGTGVQGFAGDGGPAAAAVLDSPRSTGVSPAGLLTLADTGNERLRQVSAGGIVQTLGGVGGAVPGVLSLVAPTVMQYGTGSLTAALAAGTPATGSVAFLEVSSGTAVALGSGLLRNNDAVLSTATLPAGGHRVMATYAGDGTHASVTSGVVGTTIAPGTVTATPVGASAVYGATLPVLTGTLSGVLTQDAGLVSVVFLTLAGSLPGPGVYPIVATLVGAAAGNYQLGPGGGANLTVLQAPTVTTLAAAAGTVAVGTSAALTARVASTTQGVPTGRVTFLDGGAAIGSAAVDGAGRATLATAVLGVGTHTLTAVYAGDTNFLGSNAAAIAEVVMGAPAVTPPDFTLAAAGASSQTVVAGTPANFSFSAAVQNGPLNSPIQLTASGMPVGATAGFNPAYLPPGGAVSTFVLTVQTAKTVAASPAGSGGMWGVALGVGALFGLRRRRLAVALAAGLLAVTGCGDRVASLPAASSGTAAAVSYPLTVTATTTLPGGATLQHTAVVMLTVQ